MPAADSTGPTPGPQRAVHRPVLMREVLQYLDPRPGQAIVDGTVGAGGHSLEILQRIGTEGTLIGLDRDPMMLDFAAQKLTAPNCHLRQSSYAGIGDVLQELEQAAGIAVGAGVDGVLLDLGLSSDQLADVERGFGFASEGSLDLRFDVTVGVPAWQWLEEADEEQLRHVLETYGEERFSPSIARAIKQSASGHPIRTATDLVRAVEQAVPASARRDTRKHPATRVFQALRIAVNDELKQLEVALGGELHSAIKPGGHLVIITFHSLEDRMVKQEFRVHERWQNLTSKPVTATAAEIRVNPRSRTAKLRAAVRK